MTEKNPSAEQDFEDLPSLKNQLLKEIHRVVVGQDQVIEEMLISLFSGGHCLFIGVPGLAKTLLVNTVSKTLGLDFGRVQFTPDLLPSDITGADVLEENKVTGERAMRFVKGPVFCNLLLADEINRTPPKTQAALLQAMQEKEVSSGGKTYHLDLPFSVFATQNPIEQEGTYPLPEAQLDRFMFSIFVGYPSEAEELEIIRLTTGTQEASVNQILTKEQLLSYQMLLRDIIVPKDVDTYAVRLARATRPGPKAKDFINQYVHWGAGPRASQYLSIGARVRAGLDGRANASYEDVQAVAMAVLQHRLVKNFRAEAEGVSSQELVRMILQSVSK
ncbi:MAG: MoxR family ATPase [Myxococcota bacterium]|nr:MoxR family ATPase [Myxococcota bacterium]